MTTKRDEGGAESNAGDYAPEDEHPSIIETSQFRVLVELDAELFSEPSSSAADAARKESSAEVPDDLLVITDRFETLQVPDEDTDR